MKKIKKLSETISNVLKTDSTSSEDGSSQPKASPEVLSPTGTIAKVWRNAPFYDLVIKCQQETFKFHRNQVAPQSEWFMRALGERLADDDVRIFDLSEDDPVLLDKMLEFMYTQRYTDSSETGNLQDKQQDDKVIALDSTKPDEATIIVWSLPELHVRMHGIGYKYGIPLLQRYAKQRFRSILDAEWQQRDFPAIVTWVYQLDGQASHELQEVVSEIASKYISQLRQDLAFIALVNENTQFARDLAVTAADQITTFDFDFGFPQQEDR